MTAPKSSAREICCLTVLPFFVIVAFVFALSGRSTAHTESVSDSVCMVMGTDACTTADIHSSIALPDDPAASQPVSAVPRTGTYTEQNAEQTTAAPSTTTAPPETETSTADDTDDMIRKTAEDRACEEFIADWTCDEDFYDRYFADYDTMQAMDNLENVLIVMAKELPDDLFGATFIVTAPNYGYFLQYTDKEQRENAYAQFLVLKEEGKIFSVNRNGRMVTMCGIA